MSGAVATPHVMLFPAGGAPQKRTLVLRNATLKDLVIKLSTSSAALKLEGTVLLLQARKYAPVLVEFDAKKCSTADLAIHMRPVEQHNHRSIQDWIKSDNLTPRQLVAKLAVKTDAGFSASDTIVDLPGHAALVEPVPTATAGIEVDAVTCTPIDADCATAPNMNPEELAKLAQEKLSAEKCWLFGPLIDALFPAASSATSGREVASGKPNDSCNPCAA